MRFRFWRSRHESTPSTPAVALPRPRPSWENAPTRLFPTMGPGRTGNLTPAQRWRAGGWRRPEQR
ncbi:hypothetical protein [Micromonospora halophytica]|uniref:Uncharacterized protein n=1 Tax=Micromonospora halophytica TaxID=47864 RepID=A0A1C5JD82_9ACTN|nr:hypothetical protein [Micromonospora halophytica]SCG68502.1 hypothetical protein GA0070560_1286 [Micromonospora halophytica]